MCHSKERSDEESGKITEASVSDLFKANWVFKLYDRDRERPHYVVLALLVSVVPLLIGLIFSLFWNATMTYITNGSLWLNTLAFSLAFIAFGWFTRKLPAVLVTLSEVLDIDDKAYKAIVVKWADRLANKNWIMLLFGFLPLAVLNLFETIEFWRSPDPPILLAPWIFSEASLFFGVFYGFMHVLLVPLLLGSGAVGMLGVLCLLFDLFQKPLKWECYRRTNDVIELAAWLMMWALVGLASVLLFGRSFIITPIDVRFVRTNALIQSVLATLIVLGIGSLPLVLVSNAITKAKNRELNRLEDCRQQVREKLMESLESSTEQPEKSKGTETMEFRILSDKLAWIDKEIQQIESIPALPVRWPSIARVSFSALLSMGSPIVRDWWTNLMHRA